MYSTSQSRFEVSRPFSYTTKPVVFNLGARHPGGVNKFPGEREPLRALQHGKLDH